LARLCAGFNHRIPGCSDVALIHNDYKYDNVVPDSNHITKIVGVLDWEICTLGDPLSVLGTTLAYRTDRQGPAEERYKISFSPTTFRGTLDPAQLVERYAATNGRDIRDMVLYLACARFKVGVIVQQIYYRYVHGQCALLPPCQGMVAILMRSALKCAESENQCPPVRLLFFLNAFSNSRRSHLTRGRADGARPQQRNLRS
jgi:hypothetical protein